MARIKKVVPAILANDPESLRVMVHQAKSFASYVQFDIMDGRFVPSRNITYRDLIKIPVKFHWEVHLMVKQPEKYLGSFMKAGASEALFHYESTPSPGTVVSLARNLGLKIGLAINPETTVPEFLPLVDEVDSVVFLTVHPGFYGSRFIPEVLEKIVALRRSRPSIEIGVDGGINESNILQVARAGADVLYVGAAIFLQPQPAEKYGNLVTLLQKAFDVDKSGL
jgi:ribulose-phosphate 3-epimerase